MSELDPGRSEPLSLSPQIHFESDRMNPLAQVTLPASLLSAVPLSDADLFSRSRINFMFFSSTNLFQVGPLGPQRRPVAGALAE